MSRETVVAEKATSHSDQSQTPTSPPRNGTNSGDYILSSSSSSSPPQTKLRYRQLVQPITPTELEPIPGGPSEDWEQVDHENAAHNNGRHNNNLCYPRLELSSLDLAKPRIYTRLLYFFEAPQSQQQKQQQQPESSLSATTQQQQGTTTTTSPSPSPTGRSKKSKAKARHYDHYNQTVFMDPMLLEASLALVLTDFFPLAGRVSHEVTDSNTTTTKPRPFIECNDRGVLFAVADTTTTMDRIRRGDYQDSVLPPQLFPVGLYPASLRDPPLLAIQLTYTLDKSLIMGVAMDSSVMDAASLVSFMDAWSKITQGQDFSPFPVLDRTIFKQDVAEHGPGGVYRHQRINHSPPPPILYDNYLDNLAEEVAVEESHEEEDDEENDQDQDENESDQGGTNLELAHKRLQSLQLESDSIIRNEIPKVVLDDGELDLDDDNHYQESYPEHQRYQEGRKEGRKLHVFHFTPVQLERIKKLASEQNIAAAACAADDKEISDKWVSTGDSLIAYLWKMSTIARRMEPDCKLMCGVVMDIRKRTSPEIPEGYIGNAIMSIFVQMPVHSLLTTPLSLPSRLLRDELMLQTPEQIKSTLTWIQKQEHPHLIETASENPFGLDFMVWSFRKMNLYSLDFGQCRPSKVRIGPGGFGGGEGMCVIMDSAPASSPSSLSSSSNLGSTEESGATTGVDVYLGLEGEHLRDFESVHLGFMEGLMEPGEGGGGAGSSEWEVL
ncbi:hypothetical protein BGZ83_008639 [Gryganskiella cystojenkinii]|nr:hypothetical protein BGZ83_008639 [Gryganskiella cystojenkinii]